MQNEQISISKWLPIAYVNVNFNNKIKIKNNMTRHESSRPTNFSNGVQWLGRTTFSVNKSGPQPRSQGKPELGIQQGSPLGGTYDILFHRVAHLYSITESGQKRLFPQCYVGLAAELNRPNPHNMLIIVLYFVQEITFNDLENGRS